MAVQGVCTGRTTQTAARFRDLGENEDENYERVFYNLKTNVLYQIVTTTTIPISKLFWYEKEFMAVCISSNSVVYFGTHSQLAK